MVSTGEWLIDRALLNTVTECVVKQAAARFTAPGANGIRAELQRLVRVLETGGAATPADIRPELHGPLLDLLAGELIREWSAHAEPPAPQALLSAMAPIVAVRGELARRESNRPVPALPDGYEFTAGVAHDLRSPLTSILFLAETLLAGQSGEINDTQRRQLGIIYSAALGLVSVASDIIELVRGGDGLTERDPQLFSVTEVLESVHDIVRPMAEEKGLGVHLFPPSVDLRYGHPLALSRVLLNLTTNGLKFTDSGFVEIAVRASSAECLEFSVRDTGKGYTPEALDTLYEPFRRTRGGRDRYGFSGTGLGLAISRKLVGAMGSALQVETRPKWGSRFFFEVQLPPAADSPLAPPL